MAGAAAKPIRASGPDRPEAAEKNDLFKVLGKIIGTGEPIIEGDLLGWMLGEGRRVKRDGEFFDQLCWRLVGAGLPLWRVNLTVKTFHPQILGFGFRWWRDRRYTEVILVGHGIEETEDYFSSPIRRVLEAGQSVRYRLDDAAAIAPFPLLGALRRDGGTEYLAYPITFIDFRSQSTSHQAITFATDRPDGFSEEDIAFLKSILPTLGLVVEYRAARHISESLLDTYVGRTARIRILDGAYRRAHGEKVAAIILATDLRNFTQLSDQLPGEELIALLDDYFDDVAGPVHQHGGEVLKFVGDGVLATFPLAEMRPDRAAESALDAAIETLRRVEELNRQRASEGRAQFRIGIGLHLGEVILGNVGAADRLDFTAIGPAVNLAVRLEGLTKRLGRPLLMSSGFAHTCRRRLVSLGFQPVKGISEPEEVFGLPETSGEI